MIESIPALMGIFHWQDCLEILLFSFAVYKPSRWLLLDREKNLLMYLYSAVGLFVAADYLNLATLRATYYAFWPGIALLFMIAHKRSLQKNFVTAQNIKAATLPDESWIEALTRSAFVGIRHNLDVTFVIEHHDNLDNTLHTTTPMDAQLNKETMDLIMTSTQLNNESIIWVSSDGVIKGINVTWNFGTDEAANDWEQRALLITSHTDAIVCRLDATTRMFSLIAQETYIPQATVEHTMNLLRSCVRTGHQSFEELTNHDHTTPTTSDSQTPAA